MAIGNVGDRKGKVGERDRGGEKKKSWAQRPRSRVQKAVNHIKWTVTVTTRREMGGPIDKFIARRCKDPPHAFFCPCKSLHSLQTFNIFKYK